MAITWAIFNENRHFNIPLEPGRFEFSEYEVCFCIDVHLWQLHELFSSPHLHGEIQIFNVADEIATWYEDFSSSINFSSEF